jgi:predicted nucleic acid-binding protein
MLVVDASCLFEVVASTPKAEPIRERLIADDDQAAPHVIDVEVLSTIRLRHLTGQLDRTAADLAVDELALWGGERIGHQPLLPRAWELRDNVRGWDAFYVALAEALNATLVTMDQRLGRVRGVACRVEVLA